MNKIAFLVYDSLKAQHRVDRSFDGMSNIGAKVIEEVLTKAGHKIDRCAPEFANEYDLVLVSFTSIFDMLSFLHGTIENDILRRIARKMRDDISASLSERWTPKGKSLVERRLESRRAE